jgi:hypothetical protein
MTGEWNEQLPVVNTDSPTETQSDRVQIWIIDSREQRSVVNFAHR